MVVAQVAACRITDRVVPSLSLSWKLFPLSTERSVVEHLLIKDTLLEDRKRKKLPAEAQTWHLSIGGPTRCHLSFNHDPTLGTVVKDILFATGFRTSHTLHFQMWKNPSIKNFRLRMKNESMDESGRGLKSELE